MDKPTVLWPLGPSVAMVLHLRGANLALELSNLPQITPYPLVPSFTSHSLSVWAPLLLMSLHISKEHTLHSPRMRLSCSWALRQSHPTFESSCDYLISCCSNSEGDRHPTAPHLQCGMPPLLCLNFHQAHDLIPMTILKPELPQPLYGDAFPTRLLSPQPIMVPIIHKAFYVCWIHRIFHTNGHRPWSAVTDTL